MKVLFDLDVLYAAPACPYCKGDASERLYILDEDESRLIALHGVGTCLGCEALIVDDPNRTVIRAVKVARKGG